MANISSIPPLFCSTPPPIDFGDEDDDDSTLPPPLTLDEEDDEFGDFAVASQSNDDGTNVDVPSLPCTPVHLDLSSPTTTNEFNDMPTIVDGKKIVASASPQQSPNDKLESRAGSVVKPVEAFNLAILESNTPPPLDFDETTVDSKNDSDEKNKYKDMSSVSADSDPGGTVFEKSESVEFDTKDEDNVSLPSLKLDTLSVSSEKQSACSSLTEEDVKVDEIIDQKELNKTKDLSQPKNASILPYECKNTDTLPCIVKLEDLEDDSSDDECYSPKKRKNLEDIVTSEDYFAIHAVAEIKETSTVENLTPAGLASQEVLNSHEEIENNKLESAKEDEFDDFTEFADFQSTEMPTQPKIDELDELNTKELQLPKDEDVFSAHFNQLNENTDIQIVVKDGAILQTVSPVDDVLHDVNVVDDDDEFDDFQDFSVAPMGTIEETKKENTIAAVDRKIDSENDDEFGDFEEAQFSQPILQAASVPAKVSVTIPSVDIIQNAICMSNLNDRLKTILEMMFPNVVCEADKNTCDIKSAAAKDQSILKFDSIDTAKALNYQWINSEVRHSLIKSLGIDSRNILYGEKWNSSMPRFAANLSFNPLEPMKPQQVSHSSTNAESSHSNSLNERTANIVKTDVPAVEFDWNSSGLVNPLDGSKESTYTRETETIHQTQSGQFDATVEQQQTITAFTNDDDDDISSKLTVHTAASNIDTTTAASTIPSTTTTAALSSIISTVSISNDNDDGNTTGDNNINLNENEYKTAESLTNDSNKYKSNNKETDNHNIDEVITTSTFAGPLKETHIYTPSKNDAAISKTTAVTKTTPIDFDYEIAAAGIIIDETVIKKEYRDIVYNPGFNLEFSSNSRTQQEALGGGSNNRPVVINNFLEGAEFDAEFSNKNDNGNLNIEKLKTIENNEFDDEFSDFQSVPPLPTPQPQMQPTTVVSKITKDIVNSSSCSNSRTSTPTFGGGNEMILSPAILLPQAISMESSSKPKIVWGDTTANINPDELARIEELFPQPKTISAKVTTDAQRSTPTRSIAINGYQHQQQQQQQQQTQQQQLSISASIAQKELNVDDDDWTEFVSVPVNSKTQNFANIHNNNNQNNNLMHTVNNRTSNMSPNQRLEQQKQQHKQQQWQQTAKIETSTYKTNISETSTNHTNEEEWSDFVSSTPIPPSTQLRAATSMLPQFNSAAWQNANFYNNPLSFYQSQHQTNTVPKQLQNNNSSANNYNNNYQQYYAQQLQQQQHQQQQHFQIQQQHQYQQQQQQQQQARQQQLQLQQQIHIMQDFSTAPPYNRTLNASVPAFSGNVPPATNNLQFQLGSAKVAPSISLIPDLGFVAPAAPTHTALINSLPKPSFSTNTKK